MTTKIPREIAERTKCAACQAGRLHEPADWLNHPLAGHGYTSMQGWTSPVLEQEAKHV